MRLAVRPLVLLAIFSSFPIGVAGQSSHAPFTQTLFIGSSGAQVLALQQFLNLDPETRIATTGVGSPGQETGVFGSLTQAAVSRFQEKYASSVLMPAGLARGNGRVGAFTRAQLNALEAGGAAAPAAQATTTTQQANASDYMVKDSERIDIFSGDAKIAAIQQKILAVINSAITSGVAPTSMPTVATTDAPSVILKSVSPQAAVPGSQVTIVGTGILANSVIYLGPNYIVRSPTRDLSGNLTFSVPPIPTGRYDLVVVTGGAVSNTTSFVITDPKNPQVHLASVSPSAIGFDDTITISGSGFSPTNNVVVTTYQTFRNVPSPDGRTLSVKVAPDTLQVAASVGNKTKKVVMGVYVIDDYGFSNLGTSFIMNL